MADTPRPASAVTAVEVAAREPAGTFGGVAFIRIHGTIRGEVAVDEAVAGLAEIAAGRAAVPYATEFEIIAPEVPVADAGIVVEAENRGAPSVLTTVNAVPRAPLPYPPSAGALKPGSGFLFAHGVGYARVQWQTGIAAGVPERAQGVGAVILRDFGRLLGGGFPAASGGLPRYRHRMLAGISQSAWMVNALVAEGFNRDPATGHGVYAGIFTRNGGGGVLAINGYADGGVQFPYLPLDRAPLTPAELLTRPESDPVVVDLASLTDFYRLRASVWAKAPAGPRVHRYAAAAAHAPAGLAPPEFIFGALKCNGGAAVPLNPIGDAAYARALLLGLAGEIGVASARGHRLPPPAPFVLERARTAEGLNPLAGTELWVPRFGADGQPEGGIAMPEAVLPFGAAVPPALPPVGTRSITDVCGNWGGWRALDAATLRARYGGRAAYLDRVRGQIDKLVREGYLVDEDRDGVLAGVASQLPGDY